MSNPTTPESLLDATNDDVLREMRVMRSRFDAGQMQVVSHLKEIATRVDGLENRVGKLEGRVTSAESHHDYAVDAIRHGSETDMKLQADLAAVIAVVQSHGVASRDRDDIHQERLVAIEKYLRQVHGVVSSVNRPWWSAASRNPIIRAVGSFIVTLLAVWMATRK